MTFKTVLNAEVSSFEIKGFLLTVHVANRSLPKPGTTQFGCYIFTRNTYAHLCLAPVRRLRARVINAGAGEARVARVTFACRSCLVL